jgi:hypothetical protein
VIRGLVLPALPVNGPAVLMVTVTAVAAAPELIEVGENEQVAPAGNPLVQEYVTLAPNVAPPAGVRFMVVDEL